MNRNISMERAVTRYVDLFASLPSPPSVTSVDVTGAVDT